MIKTFPKGGLHVPDNKLSRHEAIRNIPLPKTVQIPIAQHIGVPAEIIVNKKEKVKTGQIIAKSAGYISANIHSPVTGVVTKIGKFLDASGYKKPTLVVKVEEDDWLEDIDISTTLKTQIDLSREEILIKINL